MLIQVVVVLAGVKTTILLLDEEEGGGLGGVQRADISRSKVFI